MDKNFISEINQVANHFNIDPDLIKAIIKVESDFNPYIKTPEYKRGKLYGYSYGLMQILDKTARLFGVKNLEYLFNPIFNLYIGGKYLYHLHKRYKKLDDIIASYNAGRPIKKNQKYINQKYVDKVKKWYSYYKSFGIIVFSIIGLLSYFFF